jgi:hypothetical protein
VSDYFVRVGLPLQSLEKKKQTRLTLKVQHEQFFSRTAMVTPKSWAGVAKVMHMLSFARRSAAMVKT